MDLQAMYTMFISNLLLFLFRNVREVLPEQNQAQVFQSVNGVTVTAIASNAMQKPENVL